MTAYTEPVRRGANLLLPRDVIVTSALGVLVGALLLVSVNWLSAESSVVLAVEVIAAVGLAAVCRSQPTTISVYFAWIAVQNLALPWLHAAEMLDTTSVRLAIAFKEIAALTLLLMVLARGLSSGELRVGWARPELFVVLYSTVLAWGLVSPWPLGMPIGARLVSFRTLAMPAIFFLLGRLFPVELSVIARLTKHYLVLFTGLAVFGLTERFLLPLEFWQSVVSIGSYITDVKGIGPDFHVWDGLVANMFRFGVRRLVSALADPLACGYAFILPTTIAAVCLRPPRPGQTRTGFSRLAAWSRFVLLAVTLLLTINRGAILTVLLGIGLALSGSRRVHYLLAAVAFLVVLVVVYPGFGTMIYDTVSLREGSAMAHYEHLTEGVAALLAPQYLLGLGLGHSGFWAQELFGTTLPGVGENSFFMIIVQIGYLGAGLFVGFMLATASGLRKCRAIQVNPLVDALTKAAGAALLAHLIVANTSENIFSFTGMGQAWFMTGIALRASDLGRRRHVDGVRRGMGSP